MTSSPTTLPEASLLDIGTELIRGRWTIIGWAFAGGILAFLTVINRPPLFRAAASFSAQSTDQSRTGIASLAGQFGFSLPSAGAGPPPEYYAVIAKSGTLIRAIAHDTFTVAELGGGRHTLAQLFKVVRPSALETEDETARQLSGMITTSVNKTTGIVDIAVSTRWRTLSLAIADLLIAGVNQIIERSRQEQASVERQFIEGRMNAADTALRRAEAREVEFLRQNTLIQSPDLVVERSRVLAEVDQKRQVYATLAQSYEDLRIREVRDTPLIMTIEPPSAPILPVPRGRGKVGLLGLILGGSFGVGLITTRNAVARRRAAGDAATARFLAALATMRADLMSPLRVLRRRTDG